MDYSDTGLVMKAATSIENGQVEKLIALLTKKHGPPTEVKRDDWVRWQLADKKIEVNGFHPDSPGELQYEVEPIHVSLEKVARKHIELVRELRALTQEEFESLCVKRGGTLYDGTHKTSAGELLGHTRWCQYDGTTLYAEYLVMAYATKPDEITVGLDFNHGEIYGKGFEYNGVLYDVLPNVLLENPMPSGSLRIGEGGVNSCIAARPPECVHLLYRPEGSSRRGGVWSAPKKR